MAEGGHGGELEAARERQHVGMDGGGGHARPRDLGWKITMMRRIPVAALLLAALAVAGLAVALPLVAAFSGPSTDAEPGSDEVAA
jgi:hypothetical protein